MIATVGMTVIAVAAIRFGGGENQGERNRRVGSLWAPPDACHWPILAVSRPVAASIGAGWSNRDVPNRGVQE